MNKIEQFDDNFYSEVGLSRLDQDEIQTDDDNYLQHTSDGFHDNYKQHIKTSSPSFQLFMKAGVHHSENTHLKNLYQDIHNIANKDNIDNRRKNNMISLEDNRRKNNMISSEDNRRKNNMISADHSAIELSKHEEEGHLELEQAQAHHVNFLTEMKEQMKDDFKIGTRKLVSSIVESTETVTEDIVQHKYARLANASYNYHNSGGNEEAVYKGLRDEKFNYIKDLKDFKVDKELSTIEDLVLHNAKTGETHVAFRGTVNSVNNVKKTLNDWNMNRKIGFASKAAEESKRIKNAEAIS